MKGELQLNTRSEIENTLYRYAWAYDMDELDEIAKCYVEKVEVEFGDIGLKVGKQAVVAAMKWRRDLHRPKGTLPWHVISNVFITEETDQEAKVKSFYTFFVKEPDGTASFRSMGYYDDIFANDGDAWRIKRRRVMQLGGWPRTPAG